MSLGPELLTQLLLFPIRLVPLVFVAATLANICVELGLANRLTRLVGPLLRIAHLPNKLSLPFVVLPLEPRLGHSMVSSMLEQGKVREREVVIFTLLAAPFISLFVFMPRYYLPVVFPALGLTMGAVYLLCMLFCSMVKMVLAITFSRITSRSESYEADPLEAPRVQGAKKLSREVVTRSLREAWELTKKVAVRTLAVVVFLIAASWVGLFTWMQTALGGIIGNLGLSAHAAAIAVTHIISPIASIPMAGVMLSRGEVSSKDVLVGLLVGSALFRLVLEYPRHSFPFYASVYPKGLAFKLVAIIMVIDPLTLITLAVVILLL